ncbi:hypothetical protein N0V82_003257 [Gnomoniopsis sp. IMI 355080]|nr:hypothetical protein N0V82_003257 [Gnomoniopsis sp. IMI 355080]
MKLINAVVALLSFRAVSALALDRTLASHPLMPRAVPDGVTITAVDPSDIPEEIRNGTSPETATLRRGLDKRATIGVYLCVDANWQGYCVHITSPTYTCVPLAGDLNDKVSSVGPDSSAGDCRFYL